MHKLSAYYRVTFEVVRPVQSKHCYTRCPELLRTLGCPRQNADGVPDVPHSALVSLSDATCEICLTFARAWAPMCLGHSPAMHGEVLQAEEARRAAWDPH